MNQQQIESGIGVKLQLPKRICNCGNKNCTLGEDYMAIHRENIPLEEKLAAIYSKAITHLNDFKPKALPKTSQEFITDHKDYKMASKEDKASAWKAIQEKYAVYLCAIDNIISENNSNIHFLNEMKTFFSTKGISSYTLKINEVLAAADSYDPPNGCSTLLSQLRIKRADNLRPLFFGRRNHACIFPSSFSMLMFL